MNQSLIQKNIRFPAKAVAIIDSEVKNTLGIDFNDYLKFFVVQKALEIKTKSLLTKEIENEVKLAKKAVASGEKKVLRTPNDIDNYLNNVWGGKI